MEEECNVILETEEYFKRIQEPNYNPRHSLDNFDSMKAFLDDNLYSNKVLQLPKVSSSQIQRFEKIVKEEIELKKENELNKKIKEESQHIPKDKMTRMNFRKFSFKNDLIEIKNYLMGTKYIIFDANNRDFTYANVDEKYYEIINKLSNPHKVIKFIIILQVFLQEKDPTIRNQAIKEIIGNVTVEDERHKILPLLVNKRKPLFPNYDDPYYIVSNAYPNLGIMPSEYLPRQERIKQKNYEFNKVFSKLCKQNSIISLDQKIDFFAENQPIIKKTLQEKDKFARNVKFGRAKNMSVDVTRLISTSSYNDNQEILITTPSNIGKKGKSFMKNNIVSDYFLNFY